MRSPLKEKPLRNPGQSLDEKIVDIGNASECCLRTEKGCTAPRLSSSFCKTYIAASRFESVWT